jgi:hypothetical protein
MGSYFASDFVAPPTPHDAHEIRQLISGQKSSAPVGLGPLHGFLLLFNVEVNTYMCARTDYPTSVFVSPWPSGS